MRTAQRVRYAEAALAAALRDPELRGHVARFGGLFLARRGVKVALKQLSLALAAKHPDTARPLRSRVNFGTRAEGDSRVSNVCFGFDVPLSVDKSVSLAALAFEDEFVLKTTLDAMRQAGRWLSRHMDRRIRKGGQNKTVATGKCAVFFVPETAGRDGQPQLHAHLIFPNLTAFKEDGRTRHCAAHFQRIAKKAREAQKRMNAQVGRKLKKAGYAVELVNGVCRLPSVPRALCDQFSPASQRMSPTERAGQGLGRRSTKSEIRRREDRYLAQRPNKILLPLAQWQKRWATEIGSEQLVSGAEAYRERRFQVQAEPKLAPFSVRDFPSGTSTPPPAIAASRTTPRHDDVLDDGAVAQPSFKSLGVALRTKLQRELTPEARSQAVEIDYICSEKSRHLVEHTEALRTLLRLIFPRLVVHQKFTAAENSSFRVTGAATANPKMAQLIVTTAMALESELGQDAVRSNWPTVIRWLHTELANTVPAPEIKPRRSAIVQKPVPVKPAPAIPPPPAATPPPPLSQEVSTPTTSPEPEWEMLP